MTNKNLIVSLDLNDPRSKKLAEVMSSENCKKIINYLSEKPEASQKDIADKLEIPLNTLEYNLKKLVESGIVEKTKNFFWSKKGKKIPLYKLSNKSIIISPRKTNLKTKAKSILPVAIISGFLTILLRQYLIFREKVSLVKSSSPRVMESFADSANAGVASVPQQPLEQLNPFLFSEPHAIWIWFLAGMVIAILIFAVLNWRKI